MFLSAVVWQISASTHTHTGGRCSKRNRQSQPALQAITADWEQIKTEALSEWSEEETLIDMTERRREGASAREREEEIKRYVCVHCFWGRRIAFGLQWTVRTD